MASASANGIQLEWESVGDPADPAFLLISGSGAQLLFWQEAFCEELAARGFYVVRFDNRDVGLSTRFDELEPPPIPAVRAGELAPPYTLDDMADDTVGLLDALGIPAAHLFGISMGGYIAQLVAIRRPERALSLISMGSGPGGSDNVFGPRPPDADPSVDPLEARVAEIRSMSSGRYFDEERVRSAVARAMERARSPFGAMRQAAAIHAAPSRLAALAELQVPSLLIHGDLDPVLLLESAHRTIAAAPATKLLLLEGIGHELPPEIWPLVLDAITEHAATAA
ncbi:MAG: alpha/beta fold hydrolase [Gaiellaceae bacterium MAG52_C11]|nr:alpha/beta fold hydrolase [Candidatus Gaiellasilicea maunaloa]